MTGERMAEIQARMLRSREIVDAIVRLRGDLKALAEPTGIARAVIRRPGGDIPRVLAVSERPGWPSTLRQIVEREIRDLENDLDTMYSRPPLEE